MVNQKINNKFDKQIAECVGLWLAEGNNKCNNEITFTNNEPSLIKIFDKTLRQLFDLSKFNIRLYVYSVDNKIVKIPLKADKINFYRDKRANKPYFIWRLASVELHKKWKNVVEEYKENSECWPDILRGFFAGEGSIKSSSHNSRTIRVSQKRSLFLEKVFKNLDVKFSYREEGRSYEIYSKQNWDKLAKIKIANLHPLKKEKFWRIYGEFKEEHYKKNYLKKYVLKKLDKPHLPIELALKFKRSKARLQEVLVQLKREGEIINYRAGSLDYWVRNNQNVIIISKLKKKYLKLLAKSNRTTKEMANYFKVTDKSSFRRLTELQKLNLVSRDKNKIWKINNSRKKVIVK
ncbi:hypothetical protein ISS07_02525 [Candidatus Woesearchaeota archaeon]|nr:hypothetical protein [Candidatus Woesearchaeota archaeon]